MGVVVVGDRKTTKRVYLPLALAHHGTTNLRAGSRLISTSGRSETTRRGVCCSCLVTRMMAKTAAPGTEASNEFVRAA